MMTLNVKKNLAIRNLLKLHLNNKMLWKIFKNCYKSHDLLDEEMDNSQGLPEDHRCLKTQYEKLESHHVALSAAHEKLSYEFLQRN